MNVYRIKGKESYAKNKNKSKFRESFRENKIKKIFLSKPRHLCSAFIYSLQGRPGERTRHKSNSVFYKVVGGFFNKKLTRLILFLIVSRT
jgi:hypothetical protein